MSETVTLNGFVGLHPQVAYTPKGVKVFVFSLGAQQGDRVVYQRVVAQGDLAQRYQSELIPGRQVIVLGEFKTRACDNLSYLAAREIQVGASTPQLILDFAA